MVKQRRMIHGFMKLCGVVQLWGRTKRTPQNDDGKYVVLGGPQRIISGKFIRKLVVPEQLRYDYPVDGH